jgi:long-chain acyl-CoA synthetase
VISEDNKLVALIYPDFEAIKKENISEEQLQSILEETKKRVNERLPDFMAVSKLRLHNEEFAKTPKRSIRRFLYTKG